MFEFASQQDGRGGAPTMAEENDAGIRLFVLGEDAVMITVEQAKDGMVGRLPVPVLKDLNIGILGKRSVHALSQPNRPVMRIIVAHESADKTDDNAGRSLLASFPDSLGGA